jgi:uncharacterized protein
VKIDLKELLRRAGNESEIVDDAGFSFPEDGLVLTKPVKLNLHLLNTGVSVLLSGTIETEAELECARCLKKFRRPIVARLTEEYVRPDPEPPTHTSKEVELKNEDLVFPIADGDTIDLGETIRQNLLLSLPIKTLCRETCEGV